MCKCGSMWQWKAQTPGLSALNLNAVHPYGNITAVFLNGACVKLNFFSSPCLNLPSPYPKTQKSCPCKCQG
ncbi:hypothetical protein VIGAN_05275700 [Vigna angularis var. angularis]|uniref:Uncharacterized protein n=1 Tax=Vigna angularis var. angularis TaxID=157739 RepID=A0A0S3S8C2_PHAAN|nr:hypothetical protein VIGAN_05275700 [Vigna angularis var. angularis]